MNLPDTSLDARDQLVLASAAVIGLGAFLFLGKYTNLLNEKGPQYQARNR
jgi:hypothetical protein